LNFIINLAESTWFILVDSAFLLLVGIFLAGLLHLLLSKTNLDRIIKGSKNLVVMKAALFGIPLPLCSCSVLPMAHQLRQSGMNKGGTASFLISTPETGVDSILLTYSLTDPLMTLARPVAAFITALSAGIAVNLTDKDNNPNNPQDTAIESCSNTEFISDSSGWYENIKEMINYSINILLKDLAPYLLFGYILAGLVGVFLGNSFELIPPFFSSGWGSYIGAVVVGLPMYICATSSTPLAAVLLGTGFSPGAILVFLLVGPATNVASLTVVSTILKKKALFVYLLSIIAISIFSGIVLDYFYDLLAIQTEYQLTDSIHDTSLLSTLSAVVLTILVCYFSFSKYLKRLKQFFLV
jgi:uncharacterized membrane protein YraQ (UPF0718 family)